MKGRGDRESLGRESFNQAVPTSSGKCPIS